MPLMVHGNARLFLQLSHDVAERVTGRPVEAVDSYGYTGRGRSSIGVRSMRLGGEAIDVPEPVPVFDLTDDPDPPAGGMLGTRFLLATRAVLDFGSDTLELGGSDALPQEPGGFDAGRRSMPMQRTADDGLTVEVFFPAIERSIPITPSTVANALTLHRPLFDGRVAMAEGGADRSPSGTTPPVASADSVEFEIAGLACRAAASFEDLAEYGNVTEAELNAYGMVGFDWMQEHAAVLDYGALRLTFEP